MRLRTFSGISPTLCGVTGYSQIAGLCLQATTHKKPFGKLSSTAAGHTSVLAFQEWKPEQLSSFVYSMEVAAWVLWTNYLEQTPSSGHHLDAFLTWIYHCVSLGRPKSLVKAQLWEVVPFPKDWRMSHVPWVIRTLVSKTCCTCGVWVCDFKCSVTIPFSASYWKNRNWRS